MRVDIRPCFTAELPDLRALFLRARLAAFFWVKPDSLRLEDFDAATQGEPILIATHHERIVGFVSWWPPDNFVHNLFVDPAHQGVGIGKQLLAACLRQIGRPATLKCVQQNEAALRFYHRLGWEVAGEGVTDGVAYFLMRLAR